MITQISKFGDEKLVKEIAAGRRARRPPADRQRIVGQIVHRSIAGAGVGFDIYEALIGETGVSSPADFEGW
jgi:endonuclease G, mitochondrial